MNSENENIVDDNDDGYMMTQEEMNIINSNQSQAIVNMIGDRTIIAQVVQLIAYIRHAVVNNVKTNINLQIDTTVANPSFTFDINGMQVPDLVTQNNVKIN